MPQLTTPPALVVVVALARRRYRKRVEILVAIPTTFIGLFLGISYFASQQ